MLGCYVVVTNTNDSSVGSISNECYRTQEQAIGYILTTHKNAIMRESSYHWMDIKSGEHFHIIQMPACADHYTVWWGVSAMYLPTGEVLCELITKVSEEYPEKVEIQEGNTKIIKKFFVCEENARNFIRVTEKR